MWGRLEWKRPWPAASAPDPLGNLARGEGLDSDVAPVSWMTRGKLPASLCLHFLIL